MIERPRVLPGKTIKTKTGLGTLYLTITELEGKPLEVFAFIGKSGKDVNAMTEAVGRLISLNLRSGITLLDITKQLKGISGETPIPQGKILIKSVPDAIARILEEFYIEKNTRVEEVESS